MNVVLKEMQTNVVLQVNKELRIVTEQGVFFINQAKDGSIRIVCDNNEWRLEKVGKGLVILFPTEEDKAVGYDKSSI